MIQEVGYIPNLFIQQVPNKGRGVFTNKYIAANTIIEVALVIVLTLQDKQQLDKTLLHDYIFYWGENAESCCMALGLIPIYNHAAPSNCEYAMHTQEELIEIKTMRAIEANEELTINYNGNYNDQSPLWFKPL
jgi:uncharacterized protein